MIKDLLGKISGIAMAALTAASLLLWALLSREKAKLQTYKADNAQAQRDQIIKAQKALETAEKSGNQEVKHEVEKAKSGDRSHFNSGW